MASLKEVKDRIASVSSTKKITLARQMVSSAQLHHSQGILENAVKYKELLDQMITSITDNFDTDECPLLQKQKAGPVAIVLMSSNSGMCGAFNANMIKVLNAIRSYYPDEDLIFFPIGKKIREAVEHSGCKTGLEKEDRLDKLAGKTTFKEVSELASYLIKLYLNKDIKQVDVIYYQYKNMAIQEIKEMTLLPYSVEPNPKSKAVEHPEDYIFEPSKKEILQDTIPMGIRANLYYALMENQTSEHAARTMAMQLATENADQLLAELQLTYNKVRQQNITSELLDIIGSSFA